MKSSPLLIARNIAKQIRQHYSQPGKNLFAVEHALLVNDRGLVAGIVVNSCCPGCGITTQVMTCSGLEILDQFELDLPFGVTFTEHFDSQIRSQRENRA